MTWSKSISTAPFIGNDVVDLAKARSSLSVRRERFIERVCAPPERVCVARSKNPDLTLWAIWAAKEAAYKIALRRDVDTAFIKHDFIVEHPPLAEAESACEGAVQFSGMRIPVRWVVEKQAIHCVGAWPCESARLNAVKSMLGLQDDEALDQETLSQKELDSARSAPSRKVRQLAKKLLRAQGVVDVDIVRPRDPDRWRAPRLWRGGEELLNSGVSLSHHGRFVAVALWLPPE